MPILKISPGYNTIEEEFEAFLRQSFVGKKVNSIYANLYFDIKASASNVIHAEVKRAL